MHIFLIPIENTINFKSGVLESTRLNGRLDHDRWLGQAPKTLYRPLEFPRAAGYRVVRVLEWNEAEGEEKM